MIGYTTVGTNDKGRAAAFYDKLLGALGAKRMMEMDRFIMWGTDFSKPAFAIAVPFDGQPATVGNGVMIALAVNSREKVDEIYKLAMELGGKDEGPPGNRGPTFYAGYFRDLDGNKLNVFFMG